jgi:hypothetical protein
MHPADHKAGWRQLTVLAVVLVPPEVASRTDEDLIDDATRMLGDAWLADDGDDVRRYATSVDFVSIHRGVSPAAREAGAED